MPSSFDTFSENAQRAMARAEAEARRLNHSYAGTEHLLLGLIGTTEGRAAAVLVGAGVELEKARAVVEFMLGRGETGAHEMVLSPRAQQVVRLAVDEAREMRAASIGTEHLLLALISEGEGLGASVLEALGVSLERVRRELGRVGGRPVARPVAQARPRVGGNEMPIIRVEMWRGRTEAQKRELARAITEAVCNIAHTTPEATIIVFQDVAKEDWAQGGKLASEED